MRCRLCGKAPESVAHILSGCSALAQSNHFSRHDAALKVPFYELLYDEGVIDEIPPWYSPDKPKPVYESENVKAYWDPIPAGLRSRVIYKFSCAGCNACYIGQTNRHFATGIREHLASDKHSHIFKHLRGSENCRSRCSEDCFKILDSASTRFQLKIKEAMHILWEQPSLNSQVKHLNLSLSY